MLFKAGGLEAKYEIIQAHCRVFSQFISHNHLNLLLGLTTETIWKIECSHVIVGPNETMPIASAMTKAIAIGTFNALRPFRYILKTKVTV